MFFKYSNGICESENAVPAICLILLFMVSCVCASGPVYFGDPNLKAKVEQALGITDPNAEDMLSLTSLDAKDSSIFSTSGLEHAVNLTTLDLSGNVLGTLSLSGIRYLTNLTHLNLEGNQVYATSYLEHLTSLLVLNLNNNNLHSLEGLENLTSLTHLYLDYNLISNLDLVELRGLLNLQHLSLYDNYSAYSDISPLANLHGLRYLSLGKNRSLDNSCMEVIAGLDNLTSLGISDTGVKDLSLLESRYLEALWISYPDTHSLMVVLPSLIDANPNIYISFSLTPYIFRPVENENLLPGSVCEIFWANFWKGVEGSFDGERLNEIRIEYGDGNGSNWQDIAIMPNSGRYMWEIPGELWGNYQLRISDAIDGDPSYVTNIVVGQGKISGHVYDSNTMCAIKDAAIVIGNYSGDYSGAYQTWSDTQGYYEISDLPAHDDYTVIASAVGYASEHVHMQFPPVDVNLTLTAHDSGLLVSTVNQGIRHYEFNGDFCYRSDGTIEDRSDYFYPDIDVNSEVIDTLMAAIGAGTDTAVSDLEIWNKCAITWAWLQQNAWFNPSKAEWQDASEFMGNFNYGWYSIEGIATTYELYGFIPWSTCMSRAVVYTTLLYRVGVPKDRLAIVETKWRLRYSQHMYTIVYLADRWIFLDPSSNYENGPSLGAFEGFTSIRKTSVWQPDKVTDYCHPHRILPLPGSSLSVVPEITRRMTNSPGFVIKYPPEGTNVIESGIRVTGVARTPDTTEVLVNGISCPVVSEWFEATVPLECGRNTIVAEGRFPSGTDTDSITVHRLCPESDPDCDGDVDIKDISILLSRWLDVCSYPFYCGGMDLDRSTSIDFSDFAFFAEVLLEEVESGWCFIDGSCYAPGQSNPVNFCQECNADLDKHSWSSVPDGTTCGEGYKCQAGECIPSLYELTASVTGGRGTISPKNGTYMEGTSVTLTATPDLGWEVYAWNGTDDDSSKSTVNTVTMDSDKTVTVQFAPKQPILPSPLMLDFDYFTGIINMNLVTGATCTLFHVGFILDSSLPSFYSHPTFFLEPGGVFSPIPFDFGPDIVYSEPLFVSIAAGNVFSPAVSGPAMIISGLLAVENGWEEGDVWLTLVVVEDSLMDDQTVPAGTVLDRVYIRWAEPVRVIP